MTQENVLNGGEARPDTSHLGQAFVTLHFATGTEIAVWEQDKLTYPFLVRVLVGDESAFASGCAILDAEDFEDGCASIVDSVRLLQMAEPGHVVLDALPDVVAFLHAVTFTAALGAFREESDAVAATVKTEEPAEEQKK